MRLNRRVIGWVLPVVLAAGLAGMGGCRGTTRQAVEVQGIPIRADLPTDIEVVNWSGTVTVYASPRYRTPEVLTSARRRTKDAPKLGQLRDAYKVEAVAVIENGRRLVRVRTTPTGTATDAQVAVDVIVRVAKAEDVRIANAGGWVDVVGFSGGLSVANGVGGRPGGNIEVRTGSGITSPVEIVTTTGHISFRSGVGTAGAFDLVAGGEEATAEFDSRLGTVSQARPEPDGRAVRAVLNGGSNPVRLRSDSGNVFAQVIENAATLGPHPWGGSHAIERAPRWVKGLAGELPEQKAREAQRVGWQ